MLEEIGIVTEASENIPYSSCQPNVSSLEVSVTEGKPEDTGKTLKNDLVPFIGQRFATQDAAYEVYSGFAKQCGFSIRRHRTKGKDGVGRGVTKRYFVCHRAGIARAKASDERRQQRNRKSSRCGCKAYMRINKCRDLDVLEWRVTGFSNLHNHELLEPNKLRFLPAYHTISEIDKAQNCVLENAGSSVQQDGIPKGTEGSADQDGVPEDAITSILVEETPEDTMLSIQTLSNSTVPFIGLKFVTQDAAYEFYSGFAKGFGFSIRRHRTKGKDGVGKGVTRRYFVCHRAGNAPSKASNESKQQRNRKSWRCGCKAYMRINKVNDSDVQEWHITGFNNVHNHELLEPDKLRFLPAYRTISEADKSRICMFAKAGISVRQMMRQLELEKCVEPGYLPFTEIDIRNLLQSIRNVDPDNDAIELLRMCKIMKDKDFDFKYEFSIDANSRLEHIAWSYVSSIHSYEIFGDVVVFDTTYRLNAYDMPLGIWVGVNNHGETCFFGCVLLRDEKMHSFSWALKTFLGFMNGKAPQTILTDHDMLLKEAISIELPTTKHAFCIWHIITKFSAWFCVPMGLQYDAWKLEFHRLYNLETIEEFEAGWREMVDKFGLHTNRHIASLFTLRTFWALPYLKTHFFAGMTAPYQEEPINAFIHRYLSAQAQLVDFVEQVAIAIGCSGEQGEQEIMEQNFQVSLKTGSPIESHAATILTPYALCKLQEELLLAAQYAVFQIEEGCFLVRHHTKMDGGHNVIWVPQDDVISCSCYQYEFSGFLCRHALRVLSTNNCFHIPDRYLPSRWRLDSSLPTKHIQTTSRDHAERVQILHSMISTLIEESAKTEEQFNVASEQIAILLSRIKDQPGCTHGARDTSYNRPSDSMLLTEMEDPDYIVQSIAVGDSFQPCTMGRSKEKKADSVIEIVKKPRHCKVPCCGQVGHDARNCPMKRGGGYKGEGMGLL